MGQKQNYVIVLLEADQPQKGYYLVSIINSIQIQATCTFEQYSQGGKVIYFC